MLDDLYQAGTDAVLNDLAARPLPQPTPSPKFSTWRALKAAPRGVAQGANESAGFFADALKAFGTIQASQLDNDPMARATMGDRAVEQGAKDAQSSLQSGDAFTSQMGEDFRAAARDFMPDPQTAHVAERTIQGLARFATKAVGYSTAGPVAGPMMLGSDEANQTAADLAAQGVDPTTRAKVAALTGVSSAAAMVLPVAGSTVRSTVALTAAGGPGAYIAQTAATRHILQSAGYDQIAATYDPFDPVGLAVATLVPAGFGAWAMRGAARVKAGEIRPGEAAPHGEPKPAEGAPAPDFPRPTDEHVDAARVELLGEHVQRSGLHAAEDVRGANTHLTAVAQAIDQLARGDRVDVTNLLPPESARAAQISDMLTSLQSARETLLADAANLADPGAISQIRTELEAAQADHAAATDTAEIKARAKEIQQGTTQTSYKQALAQAKDEMQARANDAQARIDRLEGMVAKNASAQRASDALAVLDRQTTDLQAQRDAIQAPATRPTAVAAAAAEAARPGKAPAQPAAGEKGAAPAQDRTAANPAEPAQVGKPGAQEPVPAAKAADAGGTPDAQQGATGSDRAAAPSQVTAMESANAQRLADVATQFPDLHVMLDGMDAPVKLSDFLAEVERVAQEGTDFEIGAKDAPLMQLAAQCFLLNGG